jgi:transposase
LDRSVLNDIQWERIAPLLPGKPGDPGRSGADNRRFLEAVLWVARTGSPWRDLHPEFGLWNSMFRRFRRWAKKGVFEKVFQALSGEPDFEYAMIDGTIVRVHQHGTGAKGGLKIRRSADRVEG